MLFHVGQQNCPDWYTFCNLPAFPCFLQRISRDWWQYPKATKSKIIIDQVAAFEDRVVVQNIVASAEGVQLGPRSCFDRAVTVDYQSGIYSNALTKEERLQLDDRLHYVIHFPQRGMEISIGSDFAETIIADGDIATLVVMRRDSRFHVTVLVVYRVNTNGYNGRMDDLVKPVEEGIKENGAKWFEHRSGSFSWDDHEALFARYDRNSGRFPRFAKVQRNRVQGEQTAFAEPAGIRSDGSRDDSGSEKVTSQQSLRETTSADWTEQYLERVRPSDIQDAAEADNLRIYQKRLAEYRKAKDAYDRQVALLDSGKLKGDELIRQRNRVNMSKGIVQAKQKHAKGPAKAGP